MERFWAVKIWFLYFDEEVTFRCPPVTERQDFNIPYMHLISVFVTIYAANKCHVLKKLKTFKLKHLFLWKPCGGPGAN